TPVHRDDLAGRLDFLGVNYYVRTTAEGVGSSIFPDVSPLITFNPASLGFKPDAAGIGEVLDFAKGYGKPIYITETGLSDPDDSGTAAAWIETTLRETRRAMARGAD